MIPEPQTRQLTDEEKAQLAAATNPVNTSSGESLYSAGSQIPAPSNAPQVSKNVSVSKSLLSGLQVRDMIEEGMAPDFVDMNTGTAYTFPKGVITPHTPPEARKAAANLADYMLENPNVFKTDQKYIDETAYKLALAYEEASQQNAKDIIGVSTASMFRARVVNNALNTVYNGVIDTASMLGDFAIGAIRDSVTQEYQALTAGTLDSRFDNYIAHATDRMDHWNQAAQSWDLTDHRLILEPQNRTEQIVFVVSRVATELAMSYGLLTKAGVLGKKGVATEGLENVMKKAGIKPDSALGTFISTTTSGGLIGAGSNLVSIEDQNLANFILEVFPNASPIFRSFLESLAVDDDDKLATQKIKNMLADTMLGVAFDAVFGSHKLLENGYKGLKTFFHGQKNTKLAQATANLFDDTIPEEALSTVLKPDNAAGMEKAVANMDKLNTAVKNKEPLVDTASIVIAEDAVEEVVEEAATETVVTAGRIRNGRMTFRATTPSGTEISYTLDGDLEKLSRVQVSAVDSKQNVGILTEAEMIELAKKEKLIVTARLVKSTEQHMAVAISGTKGMAPKESREYLEQVLYGRWRSGGIQTNPETKHQALSQYYNILDFGDRIDVGSHYSSALPVMQANIIRAQAAIDGLTDVMPRLEEALGSLEPFKNPMQFFDDVRNLSDMYEVYAKSISNADELSSLAGLMLQSKQIVYTAEDIAKRLVRMNDEGVQRSLTRADKKFHNAFTDEVIDFLGNLRVMSNEEMQAFFSVGSNRRMMKEFLDAVKASGFDVKLMGKAVEKLKPSLMKFVADFTVMNVLSAVSIGTIASSGVASMLATGFGRGMVAAFKSWKNADLMPLKKYAFETKMMFTSFPAGIKTWAANLRRLAGEAQLKGASPLVLLTAPKKLAQMISKASLDNHVIVDEGLETLNYSYLMAALGRAYAPGRFLERNLSDIEVTHALFDGLMGMGELVTFAPMTILDQAIKYPSWRVFTASQLWDLGAQLGYKGTDLENFAVENMHHIYQFFTTGKIVDNIDPRVLHRVVDIMNNSNAEMRRMTLSVRFNETDVLKESWSGAFAKAMKRNQFFRWLAVFPTMMANIASSMSNAIPIGMRDEKGVMRGTQAMKELFDGETAFIREAAAGRIVAAATLNTLGLYMYLSNDGFFGWKMEGALTKDRQKTSAGVSSFMLKRPVIDDDGNTSYEYYDVQRGEPVSVHLSLLTVLYQIGETLSGAVKGQQEWQEAAQDILNFTTEVVGGKFYMQSLNTLMQFFSGGLTPDALLREKTRFVPIGGFLRSAGALISPQAFMLEKSPYVGKDAELLRKAVSSLNALTSLRFGDESLHPVPRLDGYGQRVRNMNFVWGEDAAKNLTGVPKWTVKTLLGVSGVRKLPEENLTSIRLYEFMRGQKNKNNIASEMINIDLSEHQYFIKQNIANLSTEETLSSLVDAFFGDEAVVPLSNGTWGYYDKGSDTIHIIPEDTFDKVITQVYRSYVQAATLMAIAEHGLTPDMSKMFDNPRSTSPSWMREFVGAAGALQESGVVQLPQQNLDAIEMMKSNLEEISTIANSDMTIAEKVEEVNHIVNKILKESSELDMNFIEASPENLATLEQARQGIQNIDLSQENLGERISTDNPVMQYLSRFPEDDVDYGLQGEFEYQPNMFN